jgi:hypothetical protein
MSVGVVSCAGSIWVYELSERGNLVKVNEFGKPALPRGTPLNADLAEAIERDISHQKAKAGADSP